MKGRTLTRAHLAEAVYQEVGLSRSESAELVDSILTEDFVRHGNYGTAHSREEVKKQIFWENAARLYQVNA